MIVVANKIFSKITMLIIIVMAFFSMNSVYWNSINNTYKYLIVLVFYSCIILTFIISLVFFYHKKSVNFMILMKKILLFLLPISIIFVANVTTRNLTIIDLTDYFIMPCLLMTVFYYYFVQNLLTDLMIYFRKFVTSYAVLSLIIYIALFFKIINFNMSIPIEWGWIRSVNGVYGILFNTQGNLNLFGISLLRNSGVFSEAPMYGLVLIIALMIFLFIEQPHQIFSPTLVILMVTIITTVSATGILVGILAVGLYLLPKLRESKISSIVVAFFIFIGTFFAYNLLLDKFQTSTQSVSIRLDDFLAGFNAWKNRPIIGYGFIEGRLRIKDFMQGSRVILGGNSGYSNGLFMGLVTVGLVGMLVFLIIPIIKYSMKSYYNFCFSICLLVSLNNIIFFGTYLYMVIIFFMTITSIKSESRELGGLSIEPNKKLFL